MQPPPLTEPAQMLPRQCHPYQPGGSNAANFTKHCFPEEQCQGQEAYFQVIKIPAVSFHLGHLNFSQVMNQ